VLEYPVSNPKPLKSVRAARRPYHHGDLRAALLKVAWTIVTEEGVEALTLRACARRAGVSHAAPIHHFNNIAGLLAELAADGYERLGSVMDRVAAELPREPLRAAGLGYIRFAKEYPEHFRMMSSVTASDTGSARLRAAAEATKLRLEIALRDTYFDVHRNEMKNEDLASRTALAWCSVHGYAVLCGGAAQSSAMPKADVLLAQLRPALLAP